ncbi:fruR/shl operon leader peptide [Shigella dysenteriae]|nr:fruR/shl operon leader peptide [Shigella boydii]EFX9649107.1 fruR/shl operon leader peptide [Shigella dysenteriae]EGE2239132.1 fruR/shl operon leader peptide [Shigella dysenteriae]RIF22121.1 fruR/shl operon leader peptide [Shigella dysenteriae]RIF47839.1 fruR/shl operon leader peptide [Shigella dysenteriae]
MISMRNLQPNMSRWAFFAKSVGTWNKSSCRG